MKLSDKFEKLKSDQFEKFFEENKGDILSKIILAERYENVSKVLFNVPNEKDQDRLIKISSLLPIAEKFINESYKSEE